MSLVSRPVCRSSPTGALGNLSLNVMLPANYEDSSSHAALAEDFAAMLESLVPALVRVPVNLAALNATRVIPKEGLCCQQIKSCSLATSNRSVSSGR